MSNDQIVVLSIITGSFLVFAVALAWGEHQTRSLRTPIHQSKQTRHSTSRNATPAAGEQDCADALGNAGRSPFR
jgi:hypothetical protein